jgi:hypothetical protein
MPLTWTVHPLRDRPATTLGVVVLLVLLAFAVADAMGSPWWGAFALAVLFVSLRHCFLPTRFALDADGLAVESLGGARRVRWADVRRFHYDDRGAFVSTRAKSSVTDAHRGLHLTFRGNADEVAAFVREYAPASASVRDSRSGPKVREVQ